MLLNAGYSGPQAWLLLAIRRGYLRDAGIELALTPGNGAFGAAPGLVAGGHDLAYGDVNSLVEVAVADPARAPIGIFAVHNASPSAIAVLRDGPIHSASDLPGRRLIGHASDVALRCFGALAAGAGIDAARVTVQPVEGPMAALVARLADGGADGLFGYVSTITAALAAQGRDAAQELRFLRYDALVPDLYGSVVMAAPHLLRDSPDLLARLVGALDRGLTAALAEPEAAIDAVMSFAPAAQRDAERIRWEATLAVEMAHPEAGRIGRGGVDPVRFARGVALHARTAGLPRCPDASALFTDRFLPARVEAA